ncbi:uncharacterized protein FIBRA_04085 [Fibroporia radiculosa]|uniref:Acid phosphatase n=1 Tax=Fibroporia radiculosa TaxID=599839 RepID=J4GNX0_9APHY|nr:uncharacterized protein FIBRA_04085 [Fibroporia radiculosa]CCM02010.1 predicted protein [Fibroporia radiculosa]
MQSAFLFGTAVLALVRSASAATAQTFQPPASSPFAQSGNYTGKSNNTLQNGPVVPGKLFDRFIQVWFENTNYATAQSSPAFQNLSQYGQLLTGYYGVTHTSEPNYIAAAGGDFFGGYNDDFCASSLSRPSAPLTRPADAIPSNISTVVDLLEEKNISWAEYQENLPYDGYTGYNFTSYDYIAGTGTYTYYVRKHNPLIIFDSISNVTERALRIRNFNDFANDMSADAIPQWVFVTPNLVNDGHDTNVDFMGDWINYWLNPVLADERFNNNRTLILITFDENEVYSVNNNVWGFLIGGALPTNLVNTTDNTFYTHYSSLSTVQANWGLKSLGRQDTNATVNNVFSFVAEATGWKNNDLVGNSTALPLLNLTGGYPGPLNNEYYVQFAAPNMTAVGAGTGGVFVAPSLNTAITAASLSAPVNLTAMNETVPWANNPGYDYPNGTQSYTTSTGAPSPTTTTTTSGAGAAAAPAMILSLVAAGAMIALA